MASSAPTLGLWRRQSVSLHYSLETILTTLDEGHPKMMIVKIFLFCVARLDKPVTESLVSKMEDWDKLLESPSFPLNSTRW